jgi:hypothetical protein
MLTIRLAKAFAELNRSGVFAAQDFACCQSCGLRELPADADNYCFYHRQDGDDIRAALERGDAPKVYLNWGGDPQMIVQTLTTHGLEVEWDGNPDHRLKVRETTRKEPMRL